MSLYKRGNVWWAYFYIEGIRQQHSTGTGNRRQAEKIFQKLKEEANARLHQVVQVDPEMTFADLAAKFLTSCVATNYHVGRLKLLLPYFGETPVVRINKAMAAEYRRWRQSQPGRAISDATVNRDLTVLRRILYWAVDESLLVENPLARLRMVTERRIKRLVVSVEEEEKLLAAAPEHLRRIIIAALDTGMRRGELLNQLWEHVDFSRRMLLVTKSKTIGGEAREIPLTNRLFNLLWSRRQSEGVIFTFKGQPFRILKTTWRTTLRRAQVRHIRFHDLRHSFNTRLLEAGVMQEVRMELMGHSSGNKVHSTYTHVELPAKRDAIAKLERWVQHQKQFISKGGEHADAQAV